MSSLRERRMLRMTPLSSRYWMKALKRSSRALLNPRPDGVVFDDVHLGFTLAVEQELARPEGVVEVVEDNVTPKVTREPVPAEIVQGFSRTSRLFSCR